jgi:hypothetical protein
MKKILFVLVTALSLILSACGGSSTSAFPTGKFADSTNDQGGFIFNEDGTWEAYNGIYTLAKGTYSATDTTYTEETSNNNCPPMNFTYIFDGSNLTFQLTEEGKSDPCDERRIAFDGKTYILQK